MYVEYHFGNTIAELSKDPVIISMIDLLTWQCGHPLIWKRTNYYTSQERVLILMVNFIYYLFSSQEWHVPSTIGFYQTTTSIKVIYYLSLVAADELCSGTSLLQTDWSLLSYHAMPHLHLVVLLLISGVLHNLFISWEELHKWFDNEMLLGLLASRRREWYGWINLKKTIPENSILSAVALTITSVSLCTNKMTIHMYINITHMMEGLIVSVYMLKFYLLWLHQLQLVS